MAKVIGPLHSSEARGRMGGLVFNTWRGLSVVKASCAPANPRSKAQLDIRSKAVAQSRGWAVESTANRAAWNAYAAVNVETDGMGSPKRLSGMNWYVRLNTRMLFYGLAKVATPPAVPGPSSPLAFAAATGAGSSVVSWTSPGGTATLCELYMQGPHSAGRAGKIEMAKYRVHLAAEGATVTITPLAPGTYTFFGRFALEANALVSPWVSATAVVT